MRHWGNLETDEAKGASLFWFGVVLMPALEPKIRSKSLQIMGYNGLSALQVGKKNGKNQRGEAHVHKGGSRRLAGSYRENLHLLHSAILAEDPDRPRASSLLW